MAESCLLIHQFFEDLNDCFGKSSHCPCQAVARTAGSPSIAVTGMVEVWRAAVEAAIAFADEIEKFR